MGLPVEMQSYHTISGVDWCLYLKNEERSLQGKKSEYKVFMDFSSPLGLTTKLIFYHEIFLGSTCIICVADFRPCLEISGYLF